MFGRQILGCHCHNHHAVGERNYADDELASQLGAIRFEYTSRGQIKIESKDDMAKRGMPSPDRADALMLAYATPSKKTVTLGRW